MKRIAIIGAGMAGLTVGIQLNDFAIVELFEKSRRVSGRMSTRYANNYQFDHGTQDFTVRDQAFKKFLAPYMKTGILKEWKPKLMLIEKGYVAKTKNWTEKHYVPSPKMNELCVAMAKGINVQLNTEIIRIEKKEQGWLLYTKDKQEFGPYEWVINTTPAPQAEKLLPDSFSGHQYFKKCKMFGCYTLMLALSAPWKWEWEAAIVRNSLISWMTLNSNKPDRSNEQTLIVQTDNEWSENHIDEAKSNIQHIILEELNSLLSYDFSDSQYLTTHRWRYSDIKQAAGVDYHLDHEQQLGACGDWFIKGRIEAAFLSGYKLANSMKKKLC
ncbi:MAG: NADP transhydrogenase subunit alpha [Legionellales bacterium]|nr:NADP transhydrogenase subunit alpha [Legionellales bacterium]|tara:strand:+ start:825 stop:1805 length:981 start_codon:yes stop_codon:yes gene_type:complete